MQGRGLRLLSSVLLALGLGALAWLTWVLFRGP
jgi:hypothetical protein